MLCDIIKAVSLLTVLFCTFWIQISALIEHGFSLNDDLFQSVLLGTAYGLFAIGMLMHMDGFDARGKIHDDVHKKIMES